MTKIICYIFCVLSIFLSASVKANLIHTETATILSAPRALSPFTLKDQNNNKFTNENLLGHWTLMYFGFTSCPKICPATMTVLKEISEKVSEQNKLTPEVVFVSVDPDRDSIAKIKNFTMSFNPKFMGVTGEKSQVDQLTHELGVLYLKMAGTKDKGPNDYDIDHSGAILLLNPEGKFYAVFSTPHDADKIAQDLKNIIK